MSGANTYNRKDLIIMTQPIHIPLIDDNDIILKNDGSEISIEFADRTAENVYLTKVEVKQLIDELTRQHKTLC